MRDVLIIGLKITLIISDCTKIKDIALVELDHLMDRLVKHTKITCTSEVLYIFYCIHTTCPYLSWVPHALTS